MAIEDFISGEKFVSLADNDKIFYCHNHEANNFFISPPKNNFILITHNSDGRITKTPKRFNNDSSNDCDLNKIKIPPNLVKWFGQNIDVIHEKIESIPIGLENTIWFPHLKKIEKIKETLKQKKNNNNILYICHNINTNPEQRTEPYKLFADKSWATIEYGINGNNYDNYINKIYTHKFILCPEGNGIDTHRTWETLYLNSIPIQKRNLNNRFYEDLPICFINDWSDITNEFLFHEYERIINKTWNSDKLTFKFWKNKIINTIK